MNPYKKQLADMFKYYKVKESIENIDSMIDSRYETRVVGHILEKIESEIKSEKEMENIIDLIQNYLNNQGRKDLAGFTPKEKVKQVSEGQKYLENLPDSFFTNITLVHDFLHMLDYMCNNKTKKTKKGNISLKDLKKINEGLKLKQSLDGEDSDYPFKTRSEEENKYLHLLKTLISISGLIYKGDGKTYFKVKVNKCKQFQKEKGVSKFMTIFHTYNARYNWAYEVNAYSDEETDFVDKLQKYRSIAYNLILSMDKKIKKQLSKNTKKNYLIY